MKTNFRFQTLAVRLTTKLARLAKRRSRRRAESGILQHKINAILAASVLIAFPIAAQNLIQNGSFEAPVIPANTFQQGTPASWTWNSSVGFIFNGNNGSILPVPQNGQQFVDIGNQSPFVLSQAFTTPAAGPYLLRWYDSAGHAGGLTTSPYSVAVITGSVQTVMSQNFDAYHAAVGTWAARSVQLTLAQGTYTLRFRAEGVFNGLDSLIDNVSVERLSVEPLSQLAITNEPQDATVTEGGSVTFAVGVSGTAAQYQWHKDGSPIAGATAANFAISPVLAGNAGGYSVVVTNALPSSVTSRVARLTVLTNTTPVTTNFYEGFETAQAIDNWFADNGTWEIGRPTAGPPTNSLGRRAFAGTNCAATILGGNYGEGARTRLIGPQFTVPAASTRPRLRFWHWFQFGDDADFGEIQVRQGTGAWQPLQRYVRSSAGVWTRTLIDLTPFAGRSIQLGFWFQSDGTVFGNAVGPGWYIDEVAVESGPIALPSPEGFEFGLGHWSVDQGVWQVGIPTVGPPANAQGRRAFTGTNCAATVLSGDYVEGMRTRLISPPFTVPASSDQPRLRFWHWFQFGDDADLGEVQVREGTNAWRTLTRAAFRSGAGVWTRPSIDLTAFANRNIQVAFWFQSDGTVFGNAVAPGWYIDDVIVETGKPKLPNPEGFEFGLGDWGAEGGVWQVGIPTSGPSVNAQGQRAFAGTNCAATVLAGNYVEGMRARLVSASFTVPPAAAQPRLRFWHWFQFGDDADFGQIQIRVETNDWVTLAPNVTRNSGGVWTRPLIDLSPYENKSVQIGFWFQSDGTVFGNAVGPGWYIDEVRLVHDFVFALGSAIVRTQETVCLPIRIFSSDSATNLTFSLFAPNGGIVNASLNTGSRFEFATITPGTNSDALLNFRTRATNGIHGEETFSFCLPANLARSAFIPLHISSMSVVNADGSSPNTVGIGGRAVIIANEPLLEAWIAPNRQRIVSIYGKANTTYEVRHTNNIALPSPWIASWTNTVPASLSNSFPLGASFSNAPFLFLRANEK